MLSKTAKEGAISIQNCQGKRSSLSAQEPLRCTHFLWVLNWELGDFTPKPAPLDHPRCWAVICVLLTRDLQGTLPKWHRHFFFLHPFSTLAKSCPVSPKIRQRAKAEELWLLHQMKPQGYTRTSPAGVQAAHSLRTDSKLSLPELLIHTFRIKPVKSSYGLPFCKHSPGSTASPALLPGQVFSWEQILAPEHH